MLQVRLALIKGGSRPGKYRLQKTRSIVGRQKGCDLRIPSADVSRRHCAFQIEDGFLTIEDLESANGTFLNDELIEGRKVVHPGDQLRIGPTTFVAEYQLTPDAFERIAEFEGVGGGTEEVEVTAEDEIVEEVVEEQKPSRPVVKADDLIPEADEENAAIPVTDEEVAEETPTEQPRREKRSPEPSDGPTLHEGQEALPPAHSLEEDWQLPLGSDLSALMEEEDQPKPKKKKKK